MAQGDLKWFRKALHNLGEKVFDLSTDTFKVGVIDNTTAAWDTLSEAINLSDPRWGAGGTQDLSADQVSTAGGYTGPITLTGVGWTWASGNGPTWEADDVTIPTNAGGFTDGYFGIIYDDTSAGKEVLCVVDLGGPNDLTAGDVVIKFNGDTNNNVLTLTQA